MTPPPSPTTPPAGGEEDDEEQAPPTVAGGGDARRLWRECALVYGVVFSLVLALALAAQVSSLVAANLYALVAAGFVAVPYFVIERRGLPYEALGLTLRGWWRGLAWGLGAALLTLPLFAAGFFGWQHWVHGRTLDVALDHYLQWPAALEGAPEGWGAERGVWVWSQDSALVLGLGAGEEEPLRVEVRGDVPFRPRFWGPMQMRAIDPPQPAPGGGAADIVSTAWRFDMRQGRGRGRIRIEARDQPVTSLEIRPLQGQRAPPAPLYRGASSEQVAAAPGGGALELERGLGWLWLWLLTHMFFVALPEEFFYRGYLQSRLEQALSARAGGRPPAGFLGVTWGNVLCSLAFAVGHVLVPVGGVLLISRASVFFPSLVFGWLRRRTGSIVAPVVYHGSCNMMVLVLTVHVF